MPDDELLDDNNGSSAQDNGAKGSSGLNTTVVFIVVAFIAVILAVAGAFFLVKTISQSQNPPQQEQEEVREKTKAVSGSKELGALYSFEKAIIVNLAATNAERYLKMEIVLEMESEKMRKEMDMRLPQVQDLFIAISSTKTLEDISTTSGRNMLRQELIDKVNSLLHSGRIVNIYFTEFVVQ